MIWSHDVSKLYRLCVQKVQYSYSWSRFFVWRSVTHTVCVLPISDWHDDVIKWKHFPRNWPYMRGDSPVPVNSPHKGQCRGALVFCLICVWINGWVNNRKAGDLRRHRGHYDVIVKRKMENYDWRSSINATLTKMIIPVGKIPWECVSVPLCWAHKLSREICRRHGNVLYITGHL